MITFTGSYSVPCPELQYSVCISWLDNSPNMHSFLTFTDKRDQGSVKLSMCTLKVTQLENTSKEFTPRVE